MLRIEDQTRKITNVGPTKVYIGREEGDTIKVLFTLEPGETGEITEKKLVAQTREGNIAPGVVHLFESG